MKNIDRREALKRSAYLLGGTLMAPTVAGILKGCAPKPELTWTPSFFTEDQARMVTTIADIIMPKTETPAASELGIPGFIEEMVSVVYKAEERDEFVMKLDELSKETEDKLGKAFNDLDAETQIIFISEKNAEMNENMDWDNRPVFYYLKELTITGYCRSEVGATQLLQHVMIPTRYDGCVPLEEAGNGKTWSMR